MAKDTGILDEKLRDNTFFFREELSDEESIQKLIELGVELEKTEKEQGSSKQDKKNRIKAIKNRIVNDILHYRVFIYTPRKEGGWLPLDKENKKRPDELTDFTVSLHYVMEGTGTHKVKKYAGLIIETKLPKNKIDQNPEPYKKYKNEKFHQYRAEINIQYDIPDSFNTFYATYTVPVFRAKFSLEFEKSFGKFDCRENLEYMTFFSSVDLAAADRENDECNRGQREFTFVAPQVVFPRSGISFYWINPSVSQSAKNNGRRQNTKVMNHILSSEKMPVRNAE